MSKMSSVIDFTGGNSSTLDELNLKNREDLELNRYASLTESDFYMGPDSKELVYDSSCVLSNVHWGQLKLFYSEFFVILKHLPESVNTILYVGAANGSHIFVLAKLFPRLTFYLYDSQRFDKRLYKLINVKIFKKYFDEEEMEKWKEKNIPVFFISDIRNLTYDPMARDDDMRIKNEKDVWSDMKLQESWIKELKPVISLVKFRLPFAYDFVLEEGRERKYLDGKVCFQTYNKPTSSESRLLIQGLEERNWDIIEYERKMYYHNCVTRNKKKFMNPINNSKRGIYPTKGLFNDYDSTCLTVLVMEYIQQTSGRMTEKEIKNKIDFILDNLSTRKFNLNFKRAGF